MKKVLFIDRDGTLVIEPPIDKQLDSLEKLTFYPGVFQWLARIATELDYELVMVTNQDGLGTESFPEDTFWPAQNKIIEALENEGIRFSDILIDRSFPEDNAPTRKPRTGLLNSYIHGPYNLDESVVIGDRHSDVQLAQNLGCQSIFLSDESIPDSGLNTNSWQDIYQFLKAVPRTASICRATSETTIRVDLNLDGKGRGHIETGIGFFDHMLEQLVKHGNLDLNIRATGDLHIDEHHTIEDVALTLGAAFAKALGSKRGIARYGFLLPMDDSLAQVAIDFGGRPWLVWQAEFKRESVGGFPTEMLEHFFHSFCDQARCNLNIQVSGDNDHHQIEAIFKAFAQAIKMAIKQNEVGIRSTKGVL